MTRRNGHVQCDACNAVMPDDEQSAGWEALAGPDGGDAHLCASCVALRDRGELVDNPLGLRCVRCGRVPADGIKQWWNARGDEGQVVNVCDDCFDEERDFVVP